MKREREGKKVTRSRISEQSHLNRRQREAGVRIRAYKHEMRVDSRSLCRARPTIAPRRVSNFVCDRTNFPLERIDDRRATAPALDSIEKPVYFADGKRKDHSGRKKQQERRRWPRSMERRVSGRIRKCSFQIPRTCVWNHPRVSMPDRNAPTDNSTSKGGALREIPIGKKCFRDAHAMKHEAQVSRRKSCVVM